MHLPIKIKKNQSNGNLRQLSLWAMACTLFLGMLSPAIAQPPKMPALSIGEGPYTFDTAEAGPIRVDVITNELSHPWGIAFLPNGDMLVTERPGKLRLIRDGELDPQPISGIPEVLIGGIAGESLQEVTLHPDFEENSLIYLTYMKPLEGRDFTPTIARGRLDLEQMALLDVEDIFLAKTIDGGLVAGAPMIFAPDGTIIMGVGNGTETAQDPSIHNGKIIRINDDGSIPADNPFVNEPGYLPEIYTLGNRNMLGLALNPETGEVWETENGPQGGDEINILKPGANYGWPIISFGREYTGPRVSQRTYMEGMEEPVTIWIPSIAVSGMIFYTGEQFPSWKGNALTGGLIYGRIPGTGVLDRIVMDQNWDEMRRETMLSELRQRIRNIEQGPDGLIYLVTDEDEGAVLRISPAE